MIKKFQKKLKLLLSKEEGKISKLSLGVSSTLFFADLVFSESGNLNCGYNCGLPKNTLFNIEGNPNPQHLHNVQINIGKNPEDIEFNYTTKNTCLIIGEVGGSGSCYGGDWWNDIIGGYGNTGSNKYICEGNETSKICRVRANKNDYGYVKYEWHNNDPNFDCTEYYGTFYTNVKEHYNATVNTWKNVI